MNVLESTIQYHLTSPECKMISPWSAYQDDWWEIFDKKKIKRKNENIEKLTMSISNKMKEISQWEILTVLDEKISIIYIDCEQKWERDIMFYIAKIFLQSIKDKNIVNILGEIIWENSIVIDDYNNRIEYINQNNLDLDWIFDYYIQIRNEYLKNKNEKIIEMTINHECDIVFKLLEEFIENKNYLYIYLDNIKILEQHDKKRVNKFLYSRWSLWNQNWVRLKINNGDKNRNTRSTPSWHRVESPHDYSDHLIYEKEVEVE